MKKIKELSDWKPLGMVDGIADVPIEVAEVATETIEDRVQNKIKTAREQQWVIKESELSTGKDNLARFVRYGGIGSYYVDCNGITTKLYIKLSDSGHSSIDEFSSYEEAISHYKENYDINVKFVHLFEDGNNY